MKKIFILILPALLFILCGCSEVEVTVGVDDQYNAFICYDLHFEDTSLNSIQTQELNRTFKDLKDYYRKTLEFDVETDFNMGKRVWDMRLTKREPAEDYREAFELLEELLSDERITFFQTLDMAVFEKEYEQAYQLNGIIMLNKIIENSNIYQLPVPLQEKINTGIENSKFKLNVVMPGNADGKSETYNSDTLRLFKTDISLTNETEVSFSTRLHTDSGKAQKFSIEEAVNSLNYDIDFFNTIKVILTVLTILSAVLFILYLRRPKSKE